MKVLKNIRRFSFVIILLLITIINLGSCKKEEEKPNYESYTTFPQELNGKIKDKKVYLTSIGQANDLLTFDYLYKDVLDYELDMLLEPSKIAEGSVVFIFVGCSIKALEESSLSLAEERNRANNLINGSKDGKYELIGFHLGGNSRRGSTSDSFIETIFPSTIFNIFVSSGNEDGFLSKSSIDNNVPCMEVSGIGALDKPLKQLLGIVGE